MKKEYLSPEFDLLLIRFENVLTGSGEDVVIDDHESDDDNDL